MTTPTPQFFQQLNRAFQAPAIMGLSRPAAQAFKDRCTAVATVDDLDDEDQELLALAEAEIRSGLSPTLQHPDNWESDWAAEDAAPEPRGESKSLRQDGSDDDWIGLGG